jgi:hypothetical protein
MALLFSKSVRKLLIKQKETIRFGVLTPSSNLQNKKVPIDPVIHASSLQEPIKRVKDYSIDEKELRKGISISSETVVKIQTCMKNILNRKDEDGVKFYNSQRTHRVFSLETEPGLIFKMTVYKNRHTLDKNDSMKVRYQTMINAQTVLRTHQLGLLVLPHAKMITVAADGEEYDIIAKQKLDINHSEGAQEKLFEEYAGSLNETIRQLAVFICKTGYSDVEWRNNPLVNNNVDGERKIALIDIEEMTSKKIGLFGGGFGRTGLVGLVTEEQGKIVESVAKQNGVNTASFANAKYGLRTPSFAHAQSKRKIILEDARLLKEFYAKKNIVRGDELIQVDEKALEFSDYPDKAENLKQLMHSLIKEINDKISKSSSEDSTKRRRYIHINVNEETFYGPHRNLIEPGEDSHKTAIAFKTAQEYYAATFLGYLVKKLQELGVIYNLVTHNRHGYFLQA